MGLWGHYGTRGVCRASLTPCPKARPHGEIPMGSGVLMGPEGLQTHAEPTLPSLTFRPKVRPYGEPYGVWGHYGTRGVCRPSLNPRPKARPYRELCCRVWGLLWGWRVSRPSLTSHPNARPYREIPMGSGVIMGPEGSAEPP